jgi:hypothetical protein
MSIQPGTGYGFSTSNGQSTINVNPPWVDYKLPTPDDPPAPAQSRIYPQLPNAKVALAPIKPFECRVYHPPNESYRLLQIGSGSVSYTRSNFPHIWLGVDSIKCQATYYGLQLYPSGSKVEGDDSLLIDTMLQGGGYKLDGYLDTGLWYLVACSWDIRPDQPAFSSNSAINFGKPILALVKHGSADWDKINLGTGPSSYSNMMNVHKMTGYTAAEQEFLTYDWGNGHTSWYNPMCIGYNVKVISEINVTSAAACGVELYPIYSQDGYVAYPPTNIPGVKSKIYALTFDKIPKGGYVTFSYTDAALGTQYSAPFYPLENGLLFPTASADTLFNSLNAIVSLQKNIACSKQNDLTYHITFINALEGLNVTLSMASSITSWSLDYQIQNHIVGDVDLGIESQFNGTQLMNEEDWTEADDWFNYNFQNNWTDIVNIDDALDFKSFSATQDLNESWVNVMVTGGSVSDSRFDDFYQRDGSFAKQLPDYTTPPFTVYAGTSEGKWKVQAGTLNDYVPDNMESEITASSGMIYLQISNTDGAYPGDTLTIETAAETPVDDDEYGYITLGEITSATTVNQFVTGSLWSERHKFTAPDTASYYFYRI